MVLNQDDLNFPLWLHLKTSSFLSFNKSFLFLKLIMLIFIYIYIYIISINSMDILKQNILIDFHNVKWYGRLCILSWYNKPSVKENSFELKIRKMSFKSICGTLVYYFIVIGSSTKYSWFYTNLHHKKQVIWGHCLMVHIFDWALGPSYREINNRGHPIYIYIYIYIYILSSTDRLFHSIRTLQCGKTCRTLEAGIETRPTLR